MRSRSVLSAYSRRRWWARGLVDALVALGWLACVWATAALMARIAGWTGSAALRSAHLAWGLPLAAALYGLVCGARARIGRDRAAGELDRDMGLGGLLLVARQAEAEGVPLPGTWNEELDRRMEFAREHLPRPEPRRALAPLLLGSWFALVVVLLPEPVEPAPVRGDAALAARLAQLEGLVEGMRAAGVIDEQQLAGLGDRLRGFEGLLEQGAGALEWADVDGAAAELSRLVGEHAGQLDGLLGGLTEAAAEPEMIATALEWAQQLGLTDDLLGEGGIAGLDPAELARLAADGAADPRVRELVGELTDRVGAEIDRFAGQFGGEPGRAPRGPVAGALPGVGELVDSLRGALGEVRRPARHGPRSVAVPLAATPPRSDPESQNAPVAWRSDLLPRHRAAVRRFFANDEGDRK